MKPEEQDSTRLLATQQRLVYAAVADPQIGYLLFLRESTLMAQRFDNDRRALTGDAVPVAEQVGDNNALVNGVGQFSASGTGVLAYRNAGGIPGTPVWVERNGREQPLLAGAALDRPQYPRLSPDGRKLALVVAGDVWVYDLEGRPPIKLTFDGGHFSPLWTPDGQRLVYETTAPPRLLSLPADGSGATPAPVSPEGHYHPHGWSADGREIVAVHLDGKTAPDIVRFPIGEKPEPQPVVQTQYREGIRGAAVSPEGRLLAYVSDTTGANEIWVQPYPGPGAPIRVSPSGGVEPVWARDGRQLYYLEGNKLMSIAIDTRSAFNFKAPQVLFEGLYLQGTQPPSYDVAPDGRFLMIKSTDPTAAAPITLILNWTEMLTAHRPAN